MANGYVNSAFSNTAGGKQLFTCPSSASYGLYLCHLTEPGASATGNVSITAQPADGNNFVITAGSVFTYTFKTALTPSAGEVLIGGTTAATIANLFAAMTGGAGSGTAYAAGTTPLSTSTIVASGPVALVINLTATTPGTGGNAYTLAKTGANLAISGGTLTGGAAATAGNAILYDGINANGNVIAVLSATAGYSDDVDYDGELRFSTGLYAVLNGAGAQLFVTFE